MTRAFTAAIAQLGKIQKELYDEIGGTSEDESPNTEVVKAYHLTHTAMNALMDLESSLVRIVEQAISDA